MKSFITTAAVLLPQCLALAIDTNTESSVSVDTAQVVGFPDYEADIFWGDKHRRMRTDDGFSIDIEDMIKDLGMSCTYRWYMQR